MRVLVLAAVRPHSGPERKMADLAAAFQDAGFPTELTTVVPDRSAASRLRAAIERHRTSDQGPFLLYLRSHWSVPWLTTTLGQLRRDGHRVVLDCPTPVAAGVREISGADRSVAQRAARLGVEAMWTPLAWPAADLVVQYSQDGPPWRWLTKGRRLTLTNGVDVRSRQVTQGWPERLSCRLVVVGALAHWHGVDRLLAGVALERRAVPGDGAAPGGPAPEVVVIGDGPALPRLRRLVSHWDLHQQVCFTGSLAGAELDAQMALADVGVASLGEHRRGRFALSPLKTRDYLARGLPVIHAGDDPDLRDDPPFALRLPDDASPVPIGAVRRWLDQLRAGRASGLGEVTRRDATRWPGAIREFALQHCDQRARVQAVLRRLGVPAPADQEVASVLR